MTRVIAVVVVSMIGTLWVQSKLSNLVQIVPGGPEGKTSEIVLKAPSIGMPEVGVPEIPEGFAAPLMLAAGVMMVLKAIGAGVMGLHYWDDKTGPSEQSFAAWKRGTAWVGGSVATLGYFCHLI